MKRFSLIVIISCLLFPSFVSGQGKPNYVGEWYHRTRANKIATRPAMLTAAPSDFSKTKRYNVHANTNQLNSVLKTAPELLDLVVPYGDRTYTLNLAKVEVVSKSFSVKTNKGNGGRNNGVQYRGIVDNNPAHVASLSLAPGDIHGYFSTDEGNFVITKEGLEFIVYNQQDMPTPEGILCLTPDVTYQIQTPSTLITGIGCKTVSVYFECDYAFYQAEGSNITTLTNYVIGFFNEVATLYANENIAIQISEMFAWTSPDPYASLTTTNDVLNAFRANRGTNFNGDLAHFLTTRNLGGGIGYIDVLCNKPYAYGVSMIYTTYSSAPTYSWTVEVVTHELGHNLGSPHTQSCSWSVGPLDNCYPPEGSCAAGPAPVNGGTIMSYCHLTVYGINFNNGFGFYPGNLIRDRVLNASCISGGTSTAVPTSLNTTNVTTGGATFNWAGTGATNYSVQYKLATDVNWTSAGNTSSTSMTVSGLAASANYMWTVRSDCSAFATAATFTTAGESGCATPSGLSTSNITQTSATVSWVAVPGASNYTVLFKASASSNWATILSTSNSTSITGLTAGTSYDWEVKADCSASYSSIAGFTTAAAPPTSCAAPTGLTTTNITQTSATLNWTAVAGATSYSVQYKTASGSTWSTTTTTANSVSIGGLTAATNYVWQVKANCSSSYSSLASFTTASTTSPPAGCTAPTNQAETNITTNSATLLWTSPANAQSFSIRIRDVGGKNWTNYNNVRGNSMNVTRLKSGTTYEWIISTKCTDGTSSPFTGSKTFRTL